MTLSPARALIGITVTRDRFVLQVEAGGEEPVPVMIFGELHRVEPGGRVEVSLAPAGAGGKSAA